MLAFNTVAINGQYSPLPTDFLEMYRVTLTSTTPPRELEVVTGQYVSQEKDRYTSPAIPWAYAIVGGNMEFLPVPDTSYNIERVYYQRIPALSTNSTNWLLTSHPNIYLHGSLSEAYKFVMDEARAAVHRAEYDAAVQRLIDTDRSSKVGTTPKMRARVYG